MVPPVACSTSLPRTLISSLSAARIAFCVSGRLAQHQHRFVRGQIEAVAGTAREKAHVLVRLAAVRLELQRQLAVTLAHPSVRIGNCRQGKAEDGREQREHAARRDQRVVGHGYLLFLVDSQSVTIPRSAAAAARPSADFSSACVVRAARWLRTEGAMPCALRNKRKR